jgi:two-component system KDP operon response regulator KdpE
MKAAKILVVDDEPQIRRVLRATLSAEGYAILEARDGEAALAEFRRERPDLVLLDMNMPGPDGLATCRDLRAGSSVPIIMLTVRSSEKDKVRSLDAGADDYVTKPFSMEELLARIRAALRRTAPNEALAAVVTKDLKIDFESRSVIAGGESVHLTPKEFELLRHLVAHQGKPLSHRRLLQAIWGPDYGDETEYLRVTVNQLRKKIEPEPSRPKYILTEPWVGYRFVLGRESSAKSTSK